MLRLEFDDGGKPLARLDAINRALTPYGARVWPRDLSDAPDDARALLGRPGLSEPEKDRLKAAYLLPRERLVALIAEARGAPHVESGGALSTSVINHGYAYPQLFVVEAGADYSRFDRFHVNTADDGTGVDEIMHILSGGGVRIFQRREGEAALSLRLDCPDDESGWIVTYDGAASHIGSFSRAAAGSKILMQVIGPARWTMRYDG